MTIDNDTLLDVMSNAVRIGSKDMLNDIMKGVSEKLRGPALHLLMNAASYEISKGCSDGIISALQHQQDVDTLDFDSLVDTARLTEEERPTELLHDMKLAIRYTPQIHQLRMDYQKEIHHSYIS